MVEAIEREFVPRLVFNNRPGADEAELQRTQEPAWNNPVLRFFEGTGRELLPRRDGIYTRAAVAERLLQALAAGQREIPGYLALAAEEADERKLERAVFATACFWSGEAVFGALEGVRAVAAGWLEGREVVDVRFAPARLSLEELLGRARASGYGAQVWFPSERLAAARKVLGSAVRELREEPRRAAPSDHERALGRSVLRCLPLTPLQRMRINARLDAELDPAVLLSPTQRELLTRLQALPAAERDRIADTASAAGGDWWSRAAFLRARLTP